MIANAPYPRRPVSRPRLAAAALLLFSGCAGEPFEKANRNYADAFADAANTQLLLNIARESNDEPAYFIQLGNFSTQFQLQASVGAPGAGSLYTKNYGGATASTVPTESLALGATLGATAMENPTFNFTPLAGDAFMKTIFAPLPINVFSTMIGENWHADAVIRTMVSKIDLLPPSSGPVYSQPAVLTVEIPKDKTKPPADRVTGGPVSQTCRYDGSAKFTASAPGMTSWQWEVSSDGGRTWKSVSTIKSDASGTTYKESASGGISTLSITGVTLGVSGSLFRDASKADPDTDHSNPAQLIVTGDESPSFNSPQPQSYTHVMQDNAANRVTFSAMATGTPTYNWQLSTDQGANWSDIEDIPAAPKTGATYGGATTGILSIDRVSLALNGYWYRCQARYDCMTLQNDVTDRSYPLFLALCYELNQAQRNRLIPAVAQSVADTAADAQAKEDAKKDAVTFYNLKLSDALKAEAQGYTVENTDSKADDGKQPPAYTVYQNPKKPDNTVDIQFPDSSELPASDYPLLHWIASRGEQLRFSLRSFDNALYEIAKEEQRFPSAVNTFTSSAPGDGVSPNWAQLPLVPPDMTISLEPTSDVEQNAEHGFGYKATVTGTQKTNYTFGVRPTLRISGYQPDHELIRIDYPNRRRFHSGDNPRTFFVGDREDELDGTGRVIFDASGLDATPSVTNRVEFTLLSYLFTQASIDSTKLPTQQLVEVH